MSNHPVLRVNGLTLGYERHGKMNEILRDLSFTLNSGEAIGIVGESGSGKSSLAYAIMQYLPTNSRILGGHIILDNRETTDLKFTKMQEIRGRVAAMVAQEPATALNPSMKIGDQVIEAVRYTKGITGRLTHTLAIEILTKVAIRDPVDIMRRYPHQLSGGQQQRILIAMAMIGDPKLLILDEPTTGLDITVEAEVMDLLRNLRRTHDTAVLFISHNLALVSQVCDRVGVLRAGSLVELGAASQVLNTPQHPYTADLLRCLPGLDSHRTKNPLRPIQLEPSEQTDWPDKTERLRTETDELYPPAEGPVLQIRGLRKKFGELVVCDDIALDIHRGETLGLVGESGSGKTTLSRMIAGLEQPDAGEIFLEGDRLPGRVDRRKMVALRKLQMVFQRPETTLNAKISVYDILDRAVCKLSPEPLSRAARREHILSLAQKMHFKEELLYRKPSQLSGGQRQRVAIARAFAGRPQLVLCDEPVSALDVSVQAAVLGLLTELQRNTGVSFLFISHDLSVVRYMSHRIAVMYLGQLVETGPTERVIDGVHHPYTDLLFRAIPILGTPAKSKGAAPAPFSGSTPSPKGCMFVDRCPVASTECVDTAPPKREIYDDHFIRCHRTKSELTALCGDRSRSTSSRLGIDAL